MTVSLIELKSSSLNTDRIRAKFEGSGKAALQILKNAQEMRPVFLLVLVAKDYKRYVKRSRLQKTKVIIGNKTYRIRLHHCKASLGDIHAKAFSNPER